MRISIVFVCLLLPTLTHAGPPRHGIDPNTVQRHGKGYRYNQAGWIVVHIEGEPYERGVQHGVHGSGIPAQYRKMRCILNPPVSSCLKPDGGT